MNEKQALEKFTRCAGRGDLRGAHEALQSVSGGTLNRQDADGYDMLIQAVVSGNACAVEALLATGRCDESHEEGLCGCRAFEFAMDYPENSRIRRLFLLRKYNPAGPFNFGIACERNDAEVVRAHFDAGYPLSLNRNWTYSMPPGFLQALPLAAAVVANAAECVELLLEHGADPDAFCRKYEKTPRQLAADRPEILKLFG
jgi:hypothetical protein